MLGTISPDVARAAVGLRRSHPTVSAREVLDVVMRQRGGAVADFGDSIAAGSSFGLLLAEAFDPAMDPRDWQACANPNADPLLVAALLQLWRDEVLPRFAAAYSLKP